MEYLNSLDYIKMLEYIKDMFGSGHATKAQYRGIARAPRRRGRDEEPPAGGAGGRPYLNHPPR